MKKILIVDDSPVMRRNLRAILTKHGYQVTAEASNGEQAIDMYEQHKPDLVTMDITMPVLNGIEAVKRLIKADSAAKIIVISAFDQRNMLFEAIENGAKRYIIKPITETKLLQAIDETLQQSQTFSRSVTPPAKPMQRPAADDLHDSESLTIENKDGRFHIKLPFMITGADMLTFQTAMQGLMFIKPLYVTIHLSSDELSMAVLEPLTEHASKIIDTGGQLRILVRNHELSEILLRRIHAAEIRVVTG